MVELQSISTPTESNNSGSSSNNSSSPEQSSSPTSPLPSFGLPTLPHQIPYLHNNNPPQIPFPYPSQFPFPPFPYPYPPFPYTTTFYNYQPQQPPQQPPMQLSPPYYIYPETTPEDYYMGPTPVSDEVICRPRCKYSGNGYGFMTGSWRRKGYEQHGKLKGYGCRYGNGFWRNNTVSKSKGNKGFEGKGNNNTNNKKTLWKPKEEIKHANDGKQEKSEDLGKTTPLAAAVVSDDKMVVNKCTTIMVKNIPNSLSRVQFIEMLDSHCRAQNKKGNKNGSSNSQYDFIYLPFDFFQEMNLGYAFINFTTVEGAMKLYNSWNNLGWKHCPKIRVLTPAKLQGLEQCKRHFNISVFFCSSMDFLPLEFSPPRDGFNGDVCKSRVIGKWVCTNRSRNFNKANSWTAKTVNPPRLSCASIKGLNN